MFWFSFVSRQSTGSFFKELLQSEKAHQNGHVDVSQFEENAIDLIMGGSGLDDYQVNGSYKNWRKK